MSELYHHGILGQRWGVRRFQDKNGRLTAAGKDRYGQNGAEKKPKYVATTLKSAVAAAWSKFNPEEMKYAIRKMLNNPNDDAKVLNNATESFVHDFGVLPNVGKSLKAVETIGITKHQNAVYDNLDDTDISRFKRYTDAAWYSRSVNSFLATGEPKEFAEKSRLLKESLQKNKVDNTTVYRSCNFKFSTNGLGKKLETMGIDELASMVDKLNRNFKGKSLNENRVFSTSTSPLFAIDTWRKVNPTAAKTYNTYLIINCKNTSGVFADGRTSSGKSLVNTHANQEVILAPQKLQYRNITWDTERKMFAITVDAIG